MSIEEKAREFAGFNVLFSPDTVTRAEMDGRHDGFMAGTEWMFKKMRDFGKYDYVDWGE